jgi:hypothetical protein
MGVVALASAKGSPGVTTLATVLAGVLPGPTLLADLDPAGGDVWLRNRDAAGRPLDPDRGLLSLAAAAHRGTMDLAEHVQVLAGGQPVLLGLSAPEQAAGLGAAWPHVDAVLNRVPGTVVADCGRLPAGGAPTPLRSAALLLVVRGDAASLAHLRERVRGLHEGIHEGTRDGFQGAGTAGGAGRRGPRRPDLGVVIVAPPRERTAAVDAQRLLDSAGLPARVLGQVAFDPKGAAVLAGARRGAPGRTDLVRSVRGLVPAVLALAALSAGPAGSAGSAGAQLALRSGVA